MQNDLISRSALLEKVDVFSCYNPDCEDIECEFSFVHKADVENAPTVPAVAFEALEGRALKMVMQKQDGTVVEFLPVVRCKDCKHYMTIHCICDGCCISDYWYCAGGERREDDG